jgi:pantetheine-phosphate adenylyltransferase
MKIAVYPGSFDPFTLGHMDVVERALTLFDRVIVAVGANPDKAGRHVFTPEERCEMIREVLAGHPHAEVSTFTGLTVQFARSVGAQAIVKGLRAYSDFDAELQQALMNRKLAPDIHTVFLMSSFAHIYVSSSILKDIASHGGDVSEFLHPAVAQRLKEKFQ